MPTAFVINKNNVNAKNKVTKFLVTFFCATPNISIAKTNYSYKRRLFYFDSTKNVA